MRLDSFHGARRRARVVLAGLLALAFMAGGCAPEETAGEVTPPDPEPATIAALGDSITRAYGLCRRWGDCPDASWATGTRADVKSHRTRVDARGPVAAARVHNLAVSGATVSSLDAQARQAVRVGADYVTVLIGGNDACAYGEQAMTPTRVFAERFASAMRTLADGLPQARVLVVSIPDVQRLWEVGKDDSRAVETWRRVGLCQAMLANPTSTAPADSRRRSRVRDRVMAYNEVMAALCERHEQCRWDGGAVFEHRFGLDAVSPRDYWHPSVEGQKRLAEIAWRAGFFG